MQLKKIAAIVLASIFMASPVLAQAKTAQTAKVQTAKSQAAKSVKSGAAKKTAKKTTKQAVKKEAKSAVKKNAQVAQAKQVKQSKAIKADKAKTKNAKKRVKAHSQTKRYTASQVKTNATQHQMGVASYYAAKFNGRRTASGEVFNNNLFTAAHKTLPMGSYVRVTNVRNGRQVVVRINDRGPFSHNRIIDVSRAAAQELGMLQAGLVNVRVEPLAKGAHTSLEARSAQAAKGKKRTLEGEELVLKGF